MQSRLQTAPLDLLGYKGWETSSMNFALGELKVLLFLWEVFRYLEVIHSQLFLSLFLPQFTVDKVYLLVSKTLCFPTIWFTLNNRMWMDMTGFQFLEETSRCDVGYQSLSCTPVLHQENITSRWRSFNSGPIGHMEQTWALPAAWNSITVATCDASEGERNAYFCKPLRFSRLFVT